ncbi:MAG TPA: hypothetical protein VNC39_01450 [Acidocella sp.]|jgi:hypothetical protein|uniref:hypothetical protein n=1 Tax=Acidocella sp. TaxID=50710 RepID=UPI002B8B5B36|nr:hypothetical protein [Acidocella sp.]HVE20615.1 hypothetical protein [Acidocella sp.]
MSMTRKRALDINRRLCAGYFVINGLGCFTMPDLSDVSLQEAVEATKIIDADPVVGRDGGGTIVTSTIAIEQVPYYFARIIERQVTNEVQN